MLFSPSAAVCPVRRILPESLWRRVALLFLILMIGSCSAQELFSDCTVDEYYSDIDTSTAASSRASLESLVRTTHRRVLKYTNNDGDDVWKALMDLDAGDDTDTVHLIYRDLDIAASLKNVPDGGWNREHLWPKSQGVGTGGADFTDIHHLKPSDWGVNAARGNKYFAGCLLSSTSSCKVPATEEAADDTASSTDTWLPPESARGIVARALFYMELRYPDFSLNDCPSDNNPFDMAYLSQLLQWHDTYPPTTNEVVRNDKACSRWQGNRNPFVDFPNLVPVLFGDPQPEQPYTCTAPTPPSTGTTDPPPSSSSTCSDKGLGVGSVMVVQVNSDNPDLVAMVVLTNITAGVTLYMTDNAWTGNGFRTNEGTVKRTFGANVTAGTILTYPDDSSAWESVQGSFSLSAAGDTILLYCQTTDGAAIQHISGLSFANGWMRSGLDDPTDYGTTGSALPLPAAAASITLDHADNYLYTGKRTGSKSSLQSSIASSSNWASSDSNGFALNDVAFRFSSNGSRLLSTMSVPIQGMLLLLGTILVVY